MIKKIIFTFFVLLLNTSFVAASEGGNLIDCANSNYAFLNTENPDIEKAWKEQPAYAEYSKPGTSPERKIKLQRQAIACIVNAAFDVYIKTASDRSKRSMQERFDRFSVEVKIILIDLFFKSLGGLLNEEKDRRAFNAQLFGFILVVNNVYERKAAGNAERIAIDIKKGFQYTKKGELMINELVLVAQSMDRADSWSKIGAMLKNIK